jgi:hypothetical protein
MLENMGMDEIHVLMGDIRSITTSIIKVII